MSNVFTELLTNNVDTVQTSPTLDAFLDTMKKSETPKDARSVDYIRERNLDSNEYNLRHFETVRRHGYCDRAVMFPEVDDLSDLFEGARLMSSAVGNQMFAREAAAARGAGWCHIHARNDYATPRLVPGGHIGFDHEIRVDSDGKFFCHALTGKGHYSNCQVKVSDKVREGLGAETDLDASIKYSFELIQQAGGRFLLTAKNRDFLGTHYVAFLAETPDLISWLSGEDRSNFEAAEAAKFAAESCVADDGKTVDLGAAELAGIKVVPHRSAIRA